MNSAQRTWFKGLYYNHTHLFTKWLGISYFSFQSTWKDQYPWLKKKIQSVYKTYLIGTIHIIFNELYISFHRQTKNKENPTKQHKNPPKKMFLVNGIFCVYCISMYITGCTMLSLCQVYIHLQHRYKKVIFHSPIHLSNRSRNICNQRSLLVCKRIKH